MSSNMVTTLVMERVLDANDAIAETNRAKFDKAGTFVINMMSSPGAGKTTLLERTLAKYGVQIRFGVLEGDIQTSLDADRLGGFGAPIVQINTGVGFGDACHLDANMIRCALPSLPLDDIDMLFVENVGNLVCPADFILGEDVRVVVGSTTEGIDKPLKYPLMFRSADLVIINKSDLLPYIDFNVDAYLANIEKVNPGVETILMSATTSDGLELWGDWLMRHAARRKASMHDRDETLAQAR